jgi:DNA-binding PadR family transcriptional regulator
VTPDLEPDENADLTAFQRDILVAIGAHYGEDGEYPYGLAIKRSLEDYRQTAVNHGRLYPNLDTLVDKKLVEKSEIDKRTNRYELTDDAWTAIFDRLILLQNVVDDLVFGDLPVSGAKANRLQSAEGTDARTDGGDDVCPNCGKDPETVYRCQNCGADLANKNRSLSSGRSNVGDQL